MAWNRTQTQLRRQHRNTTQVKPGDFKNGLTIERDGGVWKVLNFQQTKTARQAAMVRTKLKNLVSGTTVEDTFRMTETFQTAQVDTNDAVYSYDDGDSLVFMDAVDFDEITIPRESIENIDLVKDGMTVQIVKWGETIVDVQLPTSETYEVTYTEPGLKNAASTGQSKDATLETGAIIQVPLFVEIGDVVKVKCAEREFIERAKKRKDCGLVWRAARRWRIVASAESRASSFASVCKTLASGGESAALARLKRDTRAVLTPQSCARTHSVLYARVRERTSTGGNQALRLDSVQRKALPQQSTRRRQQGIG